MHIVYKIFASEKVKAMWFSSDLMITQSGLIMASSDWLPWEAMRVTIENLQNQYKEEMKELLQSMYFL